MARKPPRRTKERILEVSLALFNALGEPNVTTNAIADEMNISPGNLYYHYRSKDEIVTKIFLGFEREMDELFAMQKDRRADVEDAWFWLHLVFEKIWKYRFIYRDLNDLLAKNRVIEMHFKSILQNAQKSAEALMHDLQERGELSATQGEIQAVATNLVLTATYWYSYSYVMNPRALDEATAIGRGVFQVMSMISPYLTGNARLLFEKLAREYL
ncbi:MAG: TetR/AcrR family transcriptional regulator [Casimicrobiaceae bacterium]|nr:TetR/AcrR family transcriptional regulator [Casimicrobiaceae bacterium]MCX8099295.1 TetR/AcrR family transcriptional regulator [Casimicrobiaceae bacterium]MDW8312357.1 TetR/AcrR family transcriptional regulator [Burkholderiales bacterium]